MSTLYHTQATAIGGRAGTVATDDKLFEAQLALPPALGGKGNGTNPEQLFAAGYAACFGNAIIHVARAQKLPVKDADVKVVADVGLGPRAEGGFQLSVSLAATIAGVDQATAEQLVHAAHAVCPYSQRHARQYRCRPDRNRGLKRATRRHRAAHPTARCPERSGVQGHRISTDPMSKPLAPSLLLDDQVCFPLYAASNLLTRVYRPLLAELGVTYPQYLVLMALWEAAPQGVTELGQRLHLDSGTLTPLLKRMETAGILSRDRAGDDERRVLVSLTAAGRALKTKARNVPASIACQLDMPTAELRALRASLQSLVAVLSAARDGD